MGDRHKEGPLEDPPAVSRMNRSGLGYSGEGVVSELRLTLAAESVGSFFHLLQQGFQILCPACMTVRGFLCEWLRLDAGYVDDRVTTVFVNGACVDNIDTALITKGCALAFSSALPGLVGAMMRRNSAYSSMRSSITYGKQQSSRSDDHQVLVNVKLFNLLLKELGPVFLEKGIIVRPVDAIEFIKGRPQGFWDDCAEMLLDGRIADRSQLLDEERSFTSKRIRVVVRTN